MFKKKGLETVENKNEQQPKITWSDFEISLHDNENNLEFYQKNEKLLRQRLLEVEKVFLNLDIKLSEVLDFPNQLPDLETYKKYYFNLKKGETLLDIEYSLQVDHGLLDKEVLKHLALLMLDDIKELDTIDSERKSSLKKMALLMILKYDLLDQEKQEKFKNKVEEFEFSKPQVKEDKEEGEQNKESKQILSSNNWDQLYQNISEVFKTEKYKNLTINVIRAIDINDEAVTVDDIPQENGLQQKVIELFKAKELPNINNFVDWKKTLFSFVDSVEAFLLIEKLLDWQFDNLNTTFDDDKYGLLNKAQELYLENQEEFDDFIQAIARNKDKINQEQTKLSDNETWSNGSENQKAQKEKIEFAKDVLIKKDEPKFDPSVEILSSEKREKREKLIKKFESSVKFYKKNFENLKKVIKDTEQEIAEIKKQYINPNLLFEDEEYTEKYSNKMSQLIDLNLDLRNYYQEYNKLEVLLAKYVERYKIMLNNKNLGYPIGEEEKQWLKEVNDVTNSQENIFSWVRDNKVGFITVLNDSGNIKIFFDNEDYLLSENGRIMEKVLKNGKESDDIANRDKRIISNKWLGLHNLLNEVDFVSKQQKEKLIDFIKERKKMITFDMKSKYDLDLPINVNGIEVAFNGKQAVIDNELINYLDKEIQDFSVDLSMEERYALAEIVLLKKALKGNDISYEKIKLIKNRLNKLLIVNNGVKTLLENQLADYPYLKLLPNKLFALKNKEIIVQENNEQDSKSESLSEFLLNYALEADKEDRKIEGENLITDKELFDEFINYIKFSVDLGAWRYAWDEEVVEDYKNFIDKYVKSLLSKQKHIHSRMEAIQFLQRYTEALPEDAPLYENYKYLVDIILDPFI